MNLFKISFKAYFLWNVFPITSPSIMELISLEKAPGWSDAKIKTAAIVQLCT